MSDVADENKREIENTKKNPAGCLNEELIDSNIVPES